MMITEKRKNLIAVWSFFVVAGVIFFILGLTLKLPPKELAYYSNSDNTYEVVEYVNGAAYNYIIAASQWAGEYSARSTEKTIYLCCGVFMFALGFVNIIKYTNFKKKDTNEKEANSSNTIPHYGTFTDIMKDFDKLQNSSNSMNKDKTNFSNNPTHSPIGFKKLQQEYQSNKETKVETTNQTPFNGQSNNNK